MKRKSIESQFFVISDFEFSHEVDELVVSLAKKFIFRVF